MQIPSGTVRMMPSLRVDASTLRYVATSAGQTFLSGPSTQSAGDECLIVVLSESEGFESCGNAARPFDSPNITWADRADGSHQVSVQLPPGYDAATVNGVPVKVVNGVFGYDAGPDVARIAL